MHSFSIPTSDIVDIRVKLIIDKRGDEDVQKLQLDPETLKALREELQRIAQGEGWRLELVEGRDVRGMVGENEDDAQYYVAHPTEAEEAAEAAAAGGEEKGDEKPRKQPPKKKVQVQKNQDGQQEQQGEPPQRKQQPPAAQPGQRKGAKARGGGDDGGEEEGAWRGASAHVDGHGQPNSVARDSEESRPKSDAQHSVSLVDCR